MGADGYAFDYWLAEGSSDRIYDNPYTVNLTKNTNFTAYFRTPLSSQLRMLGMEPRPFPM